MVILLIKATTSYRALKLTPREKIELEFIHISIKTDVSRSRKHNKHTHEIFLRGLTLNFSGMLGDLIAGSTREMNHSERFQVVSKKLMCSLL